MITESKRIDICGIPVDEFTLDEMLDRFVVMSGEKSQSDYVCYLNAHVHNLARHDEELRQALANAAICYADGASIVVAGRLFGGRKLRKRMTGADFFPEAIQRLSTIGRRVFFLGGKPGVLDRALVHVQKEHPSFTPVGSHHGFFDETTEPEIIQMIHDAKPDLLIVGMGTPRQEKWIAKNVSKLDVPLVWAVGALMDYSAGDEMRCPAWMGNMGMEWLFRLCMQPRKMASRYIMGNPRFVCAILRERLFRRS